MANNKFSIGEALRFGWDAVTKNLGLFLGMTVIWVILIYVPTAVANTYKDKSTLFYMLASIAASVIGVIVQLGMMKVMLDFYDGKKINFSGLFSCGGLVIPYAISAFFYNAVSLAGLLLLIIPGVIWMVQFGFYGYFIVDKGSGPIEALKKSSAITKGVKWDLILFGLAFFGINLAGILALGIGILVTLPVTMLATAFIYRKLSCLSADKLAGAETAQPAAAA
ncbi:MAG: DUF975 family protein [Candidatus Omnitrophota bacterium]